MHFAYILHSMHFSKHCTVPELQYLRIWHLMHLASLGHADSLSLSDFFALLLRDTWTAAPSRFWSREERLRWSKQRPNCEKYWLDKSWVQWCQNLTFAIDSISQLDQTNDFLDFSQAVVDHSRISAWWQHQTPFRDAVRGVQRGQCLMSPLYRSCQRVCPSY